jgi:hypothetical protein
MILLPLTPIFANFSFFLEAFVSESGRSFLEKKLQNFRHCPSLFCGRGVANPNGILFGRDAFFGRVEMVKK